MAQASHLVVRTDGPLHVKAPRTTRMADADAMEEAWHAIAEADTIEKGRRAFDTAMSRATRALEETTKAQELEYPRRVA